MAKILFSTVLLKFALHDLVITATGISIHVTAFMPLNKHKFA
jgi:hypothetical protein